MTRIQELNQIIETAQQELAALKTQFEADLESCQRLGALIMKRGKGADLKRILGLFEVSRVSELSEDQLSDAAFLIEILNKATQLL